MGIGAAAGGAVGGGSDGESAGASSPAANRSAAATGSPQRGPGGGGDSAQLPRPKGAMGIKELRTQSSLRRQLQRWRSMRWLSRADVNLDESLSQGLLAGGGRWWQRLWQRRSPAIAAGLLLVLALLGVAGVLLTDAARLLPCMKGGAACFNLALAEFEDICDFEALPVRLTTTAFLPPIYSRLHIKSAGFDVGVRGSGEPPVGSCYFDERHALSSMVLTGGTQNLTVDTVLYVTYVRCMPRHWLSYGSDWLGFVVG